MHRLEKKYLIDTKYPEQIENLIKLHRHGFTEIYWERQINNIYFDSQGFENYYDNYDGTPNRLKVRLRWYDDLKLVKNPQIEFKIKKGDFVLKKIFSSSSFSLNKLPKNLASLSDPNLDILLKKSSFYSPVLANSYSRKYFLSRDQKIRLTIDFNVKFTTIRENKMDTSVTRTLPSCILEMKYDPNSQEIADNVAKYFPYSMTKSSKYVMGIDSCYHGVVQL